MRGLDSGERAIQGGEVGELHVSGLNLLRRELKVPRCTSIASEKALKPEVSGGADSRVHTHVGHHACEDQLRCVERTE